MNNNIDNSNNQNIITETGPQEIHISDQISGRGASVQTRAISEMPSMYSDLPNHHIPNDFKMSVDPWINRPFYVGAATWPTTALRFSILPGLVSSLPRDVFNSNPALTSLLRMASMYRMKLCLNVSITGTICHQGTLLVSIMPPGADAPTATSDGGRRINTMMSGPHAFLAANEASSVCLDVPWYNNQDLGVLDTAVTTGVLGTTDIISPNADVATLMVMVLNPLVPATGASTSINVVVEAFFKELDLFVPSPKILTLVTTPPTSYSGEMWSVATKAIDATFDLGKRTANDALDTMRTAVRQYSGLHNPNIAKLETKEIMSLRNYFNVVDSGTAFEKLDPYSSVDRVIDEPIFNTTKDEMTMKSIISKPQYLGSFTVTTTNNTGALLWARPIWPYQGGNTSGNYIANNIEAMYHMTRAWKGGIKIHIQSAMSNKHSVKLKLIKYYNPPIGITAGYPPMSSVVGAPSELLEYSGGNQTLDVKLPYLCRNRISYNSRDLNVGALIHGMYYIYVAQPLVAGDAAPTSVEFNVYMSCDSDFQYYGYSKEMVTLLPIAPAMVGESAQVMNQPSTQNSLRTNSSVETDVKGDRLVPVLDVKALIRRFQFSSVFNYTIPTGGVGTVALPLSTLYAEAYDSGFRGSNMVIPAMYYGKSFGMKFKVKTTPGGITNISYVAPNIASPTALANPFRRTGLDLYPAAQNPIYFNEAATTQGIFPLPSVEFPTVWSFQDAVPGVSPTSLHEFTIPNVTNLKFIGGPQKMNTASFTTTAIQNPPSDFGSLVFNFTGSAGDVINVFVYYAFTDETRLGFQVIAPLLNLANTGTSLVTPDVSDSGYPLMTPNTFIYFSNLSTSYT